MRLDIGCGDCPTGDVNCDLFIGKTPHLDETRNEINPKIIPNFVRCDANCLPFRDKIFSESYCSHVLEHQGVNPIKVLSEIKRITCGRLVIIVPYRFARRSWIRYKQHDMHDKYFNSTNVRKLFSKLGLNAKIELKYRYLPHNIFPLIRLPWEIIVKAFKIIGNILKCPLCYMRP